MTWRSSGKPVSVGKSAETTVSRDEKIDLREDQLGCVKSPRKASQDSRLFGGRETVGTVPQTDTGGQVE